MIIDSPVSSASARLGLKWSSTDGTNYSASSSSSSSSILKRARNQVGECTKVMLINISVTY